MRNKKILIGVFCAALCVVFGVWVMMRATASNNRNKYDTYVVSVFHDVANEATIKQNKILFDSLYTIGLFENFTLWKSNAFMKLNNDINYLDYKTLTSAKNIADSMCAERPENRASIGVVYFLHGLKFSINEKYPLSRLCFSLARDSFLDNSLTSGSAEIIAKLEEAMSSMSLLSYSFFASITSPTPEAGSKHYLFIDSISSFLPSEHAAINQTKETLYKAVVSNIQIDPEKANYVFKDLLTAFLFQGCNFAFPNNKYCDLVPQGSGTEIFRFCHNTENFITGVKGIALSDNGLFWSDFGEPANILPFDNIKKIDLIYKKGFSLSPWLLKVNDQHVIRLAGIDDSNLIKYIDALLYFINTHSVGSDPVELYIPSREAKILKGDMWERHKDVVFKATSMVLDSYLKKNSRGGAERASCLDWIFKTIKDPLAAPLLLGNVGDPPNKDTLSANMLTVGFVPKSDNSGKGSERACHIVGGDSKNTKSMEAIHLLEKNKIGVNGAVNGVLVPESTVLSKIFIVYENKKMPYNDWVCEMLERAKNQKEAIETIQYIRYVLENDKEKVMEIGKNIDMGVAMAIYNK